MADSSVATPATAVAVGAAVGAAAAAATAVVSSVTNKTEKTKDDNDPKSQLLGYSVQEIHFGILTSKDHPEYAQSLAATVGQMCPDRFRMTVLVPGDDSGSKDEAYQTWPSVHVLVLGCRQPNIPQEQAQLYLEKQQKQEPPREFPTVVLTDLDLSRHCADRRTFYNVLAAAGLQSLLPRHAFVSRDHYNASQFPSDHNTNGNDNDDDDDDIEIVDRRDQLEINGKVLLKPVLERPVDPTDPEVRVYYPRSQGGGCKILTFGEHKNDISKKDKEEPKDDTVTKHHTAMNASIQAKFQSDVRHIRENPKSSFIYEELAETPTVFKRRPGRKQGRINSLVPNLKSLATLGSTPSASFGDDDQISYESDLSRLDRKIFVVTTASLPWMTGTAVNPLLRVAYLKRGRPAGAVTLVIPWLEKEADQVSVFGEKKFATMEEQETYVRSWLRDSASMPEEADENTGIQIM